MALVSAAIRAVGTTTSTARAATETVSVVTSAVWTEAAVETRAPPAEMVPSHTRAVVAAVASMNAFTRVTPTVSPPAVVSVS